MTPAEHAHDALHNDGVAHEDSDVNIRAIFGFAVIIAVVSIVCAVIVWGFFVVFEKQAEARDPRLSPLAMPPASMPNHTSGTPTFGSAAGPQLLTDEPLFLKHFREKEDATLHAYGWVDEKGGVAHVPIDQAKKLILERGLPARSEPVDPTLGTDVPAFGEATSGRSIPARERSAVSQPAAASQPGATEPAAPPAPAANQTPAPAPSGRGGGA